MTAPGSFHEGALSLEQWQQVEALASTLSPSQARWISGYFAGLDAGLTRAGVSDAGGVAAGAPLAAPTRSLTILYASETGNSRELAGQLAGSLRERGLSPELFDVATYKVRRLKEEQDVLLIASTHGEGDPPQSAIPFFEFVEGQRAPKLAGVRFAVLALGDSSYEKYCEGGRRLDSRFEALGATRLKDRVDCDVDYDEPAEARSLEIVDLLASEAASVPAAPSRIAAGALPFAAPARFDKRNPFPATILETVRIVGRHSSKETRHVELSLEGSGLRYEPGDAIGIAAHNDPAVVQQILDLTGLGGEAEIKIKTETLTLGEALRTRFEIMLSAPRFLTQWAKLSGSSELDRLAAEEGASERHAFLERHHVVDFLRKYPVTGIDADSLVAGLRPLQPRLYSIASSLAAAPDEAHITVSPVRYSLWDQPRTGVASGHLADRGEIGSQLPVYIQENPHFRLPSDGVPIIMVGAGTGVAPYRAFLQEREARGVEGRSWLFFGERNFRSDFLYQTEWQAWLEDGTLSRMDVAFSRDSGPKAYVQHRMVERSADLYAWLEEGAHLYVCGDAAAMAPDVHEALIAIVESEGGRSREGAEDYVRALQASQRYQRDVY
jgi:sulfite reductase (NADPH) flavoprotein alpha-component